MNHEMRRFIDESKVVLVLDDLEFRVVESQIDRRRIILIFLLLILLILRI